MSVGVVGVVGLVTAIGDAKIRIQNLDDCAFTLDWSAKKGTKITFGTDVALTPNGTELLGLVLWLPRDAVDVVLHPASDQTDGGETP